MSVTEYVTRPTTRNTLERVQYIVLSFSLPQLTLLSSCEVEGGGLSRLYPESFTVLVWNSAADQH